MEEYVRDVTGLNVELVQKTNLYLREALEKFSACVAAVPNTVEASVRMNTLATVGHATGSLGVCAASAQTGFLWRNSEYVLYWGCSVRKSRTLSSCCWLACSN